MPRFSIVLPCYNAEATIAQTLASVSAQSFADFEAICVDDGSTDATAAMIDVAARRDPRIRMVANEGKGPSAARNYGALIQAKGEILAFLDADDLWTSNKLERLNDCFADPSVGACYARVGIFETDPSDCRTKSTTPQGTLTVATLLGENPVCTVSNLAIRREAFRQSQGFDETIVHNEDLEWLIRIVASGVSVAPIHEVLVWYRTSVTGLSSDLEAMRKGRMAALATARAHGFAPKRHDEAVHFRYLARRALRVQSGRMAALRLTAKGIAASPMGFFNNPYRGTLTMLGAVLNAILPRGLSRDLFSH